MPCLVTYVIQIAAVGNTFYKIKMFYPSSYKFQDCSR